MKMTPEQEAAYALKWDLSRDGLKPDVQAEYDRQLEVRRQHRPAGPDAVFEALGVQVRGESVEAYAAPFGAGALGLLAGAEARLTDGSQAWSPGRAVFLPVGLAGLATKTKAAAFVIFADGTYHRGHAERQCRAEGRPGGGRQVQPPGWARRFGCPAAGRRGSRSP
jgi:hypothetical protein